MKNRINKNNRTVYRKENTKGNFTTVHNSILKDKRLSGNAFKLLVCILSNSDDFAFSPKYYQNETGLSESTYLRTMKELVECGYAKVYKINEKANINHYMFSEFGNLKTEEPKANPEEPTMISGLTQNNPEVEKISSKTKQLIDRYKTKIKFAPNGKITIPDFHSITNDYFRVVPFNYVSSEVLKIEDEKSLLECVNNLLNLIKDLDIEVKKIEEKDNSTEKISEEEIKQMVSTRVGSLTIKDRETVVNKILNRYKENPSMTKEKIGSTIASFVSTIKNNKLQSQDQYYQN